MKINLSFVVCFMVFKTVCEKNSVLLAVIILIVYDYSIMYLRKFFVIFRQIRLNYILQNNQA